MLERRNRRNRKSRLDKWKESVSTAILASKAAQGDAWAGTKLALDTALQWKEEQSAKPSGMPPKLKRSKARKFKNRRRRKPKFMGVSRIPIRRIVPYAATSGSQHRWYYPITLQLFAKMFYDQYAEFKVTRIFVKYLPNNSTNETGLYTAVLLDREGFGAYGAATAAAWFSYIGAMPGARVRPRFTSSSYSWIPTEPTARDWFNRKQKITYCTIYICNNGKETDELGGMLEITCTMMARGMYYNAAVTAIIKDNPEMFCNHPMHNGDITMENLHLSHQIRLDGSPPIISRASSISGFHELG